MKEKDALEGLKKICNTYDDEKNCPFYNKEKGECIFILVGLEFPLGWED